jgi:hypothetical protein
LDWANERWIKVYVRDTPDWQKMSWDAKAMLMLLLRKADSRGVVDLGKDGRENIAWVLGHAELKQRLDLALDELLADGCVSISTNALVIRNFTEAQQARTSDAEKQRKYRDRKKGNAVTTALPIERIEEREENRKEEKDKRVTPVRNKFQEVYSQVVGHDYPVVYGRDGNCIKSIPDSYSTGDLLALVDAYFQEKDKFWYKQTGPTIPSFARWIGVYVPNQKLQPPKPKQQIIQELEPETLEDIAYRKQWAKELADMTSNLGSKLHA